MLVGDSSRRGCSLITCLHRLYRQRLRTLHWWKVVRILVIITPHIYIIAWLLERDDTLLALFLNSHHVFRVQHSVCLPHDAHIGISQHQHAPAYLARRFDLNQHPRLEVSHRVQRLVFKRFHFALAHGQGQMRLPSALLSLTLG